MYDNAEPAAVVASTPRDYVPVSQTEDVAPRTYLNPDEMEAFGCAGPVSKEIYDSIMQRRARDKKQRRRNFAAMSIVAVGMLFLCVYFYALCVDLPEVIYISNNYRDIKHLNHTTKAMSKDVKEGGIEIGRLQDYLVAEYFDPCDSAKCHSQRLLDMFGGELPPKYQHYLMEQGTGRAK